MKKYDRKDHISMAMWAADCAQRVLPLFETTYPNDPSPRKAIETCRTWVQTGIFKMATIREASLMAHAAAREAKAQKNSAACFAARAAGQAVATAHVPQHALGAVYYALKATAEADPFNAESNVAKEFEWQTQHIAKKLKEETLKRVIIQKNANKITIKIQKDKEF